MSSETEDERIQHARDLAYAFGRREADVDAHLRSHENRLDAINGSIEKHAKNAGELRDSIEDVKDMVEGIAAALATAKAVEADRVDQVKQANEKQISNRTYWLGVATICAMIIVGLYAKSHGVG
jgi:phage shock protein A